MLNFDSFYDEILYRRAQMTQPDYGLMKFLWKYRQKQKQNKML